MSHFEVEIHRPYSKSLQHKSDGVVIHYEGKTYQIMPTREGLTLRLRGTTPEGRLAVTPVDTQSVLINRIKPSE